MTANVETGPRQKPVNRRAMLGLGLGNTVEWYDWQVYGLLAALMGPHFFPATDPVTSTLNALAVFAVGFAARPFGGMLLGTFADRIGRRTIMLTSVGIMAVSTVIIAVLPTYQQIGSWAGIILVVCRLAQGLSTGVEAPLGSAYAAELAPGQEGRYAGGMISMFVNFGVVGAPLVAFLTSSVIGDAAMAEWGWRVPFVFGALLGVVVVYLRRALPETLFEGCKAPKETTGDVWREVGRHWIGLVAIVFVVGAVQAYSYAWNVGLPSLARGTFKENPTTVYGLTTLVGLIMIVSSPVVGIWADRFRLSRAFLVGRILAVPTVFLMLAYAEPGIGTLAAVLLIGGVVLAMNLTLYNVVSVSLMPLTCRATGCGIGYGIGVALFGGTASYLLVWLQRAGLGWVFPVYLSALCAISVALYLIARRYGRVYLGK